LRSRGAEAGGRSEQVAVRPSRGSGSTQLAREVVAASRAALAGLPRLSEFAPERRIGVSGPPLPPRRFHGLEVFRRSCCSGPAPGATPAGSGPSQGSLPRVPPATSRPRAPLLGFRAPSTTQACGSASPGGCLPRHVPSARFLTSSTGSAPHASRPRGPLPSMGFLTPFQGLFGLRAAARRRAARDPLPRGPSPRALRIKGSVTPRRRIARSPPSSTGRRPPSRPRSWGVSPPEPSIPPRCGDRRRRRSPSRASSRAVSFQRPRRNCAPGSVRCGTGGSR